MYLYLRTVLVCYNTTPLSVIQSIRMRQRFGIMREYLSWQYTAHILEEAHAGDMDAKIT